MIRAGHDYTVHGTAKRCRHCRREHGRNPEGVMLADVLAVASGKYESKREASTSGVPSRLSSVQRSSRAKRRTSPSRDPRVVRCRPAGSRCTSGGWRCRMFVGLERLARIDWSFWSSWSSSDGARVKNGGAPPVSIDHDTLSFNALIVSPNATLLPQRRLFPQSRSIISHLMVHGL